MQRVLATYAIALVSVASMAPAQPAPPRANLALQDLFWWLPEDTETAMVTQVPARSASGPLFEEMTNLSPDLKLGDTGYAETITRHLKSARLRATLQGSRHFRPPSGLGEMRYEGAAIYVFEKSIGASGNALIAELKKTAVSAEQLQGVTVLEFRDQIESDTWSSYLAFPRADTFVAATSREYLRQLLGRVVTRPARRALPETLAEWRWIDVTSPFWAIRHYRRDYHQEDPTSPFRTGTSDAPVGVPFDVAAVGVTAHVSDDGRTVLVRYLSKASTAEQLATRMFKHPGDRVNPSIRRIADDTIEVRFTANDGEHLSMFLFYLFAAFGHAVYV